MYVRATASASVSSASLSLSLPLPLSSQPPPPRLCRSRALICLRPCRACLHSPVPSRYVDHRRLARTRLYLLLLQSFITNSLSLLLDPPACFSVRRVARHLVVSEPVSIDSPRQRLIFSRLYEQRFLAHIVFRSSDCVRYVPRAHTHTHSRARVLMLNGLSRGGRIHPYH